jgi:hypothetical protein
LDSSELGFYTYCWLRESGTPYYVGKGKEDRAWRKGSPDSSRVLLLKTHLSEEEAFRHETYMIYVFGRKDLGTGILRNLTNGGEGASGQVFSEATKQFRSERMKGDKNPSKRPEVAAKISASKSGVPQPPEVVERRVAPNRGKKRSPEAIKATIEKTTGQKRPAMSENIKKRGKVVCEFCGREITNWPSLLQIHQRGSKCLKSSSL